MFRRAQFSAASKLVNLADPLDEQLTRIAEIACLSCWLRVDWTRLETYLTGLSSKTTGFGVPIAPEVAYLGRLSKCLLARYSVPQGPSVRYIPG